MKRKQIIHTDQHELRGIRRPGARFFYLHFQIYFAVISFLGAFYLEPIISPPVWPFYAAAGWGLVLLLQFVLVFRKRRQRIH